MGLDITVYKIIKSSSKELKNNRKINLFRLVDKDFNYKNPFPEWTKKFEIEYTQTYYDWDKYQEESGINLDDYTWLGKSYSKDGNFMLIVHKDYHNLEYYEREKHVILIDMNKLPTKDRVIKVLPNEEVGYQRKGLNSKFYDDYQNGKIGYFVWTKAELERYKEEYCDDSYEYTYSNGEKETVGPKEDFQNNIINNFTEGEDCVTFDW